MHIQVNVLKFDGCGESRKVETIDLPDAPITHLPAVKDQLVLKGVTYTVSSRTHNWDLMRVELDVFGPPKERGV